MAYSSTLLILLPLVAEVSCTFSLFLPEKPVDYSQQQQQYLQQPQEQYGQYGQDYQQLHHSQPSSVYWAENPQVNDEYQAAEEPGYRYQSYQSSSYRHQVGNLPYPTAYPYYHQQHSHIPSNYHQLSEPVVVQPPRLASPLPIYQLVTVGPEVPVLVRLPDQQTAILPVRTVYSLPNFLERIVQRFQNYYSVYNPLEVPQQPNLIDPVVQAETEAPATTGDDIATTKSGNLLDRSGESNTTPKVATLKVVEVTGGTTTMADSQAATTTDTTEEATTSVTNGNEIQEETTTVA